MAKLRHLRTSVAGRRPLPSELLPGQIFINRADRTVSILDSDNQVVDMGNAVPVGTIGYKSIRAGIESGEFALDGQELSQALYPSLYQRIVQGKLASTDETNWQSNPLQRGKFVAESSAGMFRLADFNGKSPGSIGSVFLGGDGANSASEAGLIQEDAMQRLQGSFTTRYGPLVSAGGIFHTTSGAPASASTAYPESAPLTQVNFDNILVSRTAERTRPLNVTGCWVIQAFGKQLDSGAIDIGQLAIQVEELRNPPFCKLGITASRALTPGSQEILAFNSLIKATDPNMVNLTNGRIYPKTPGWYRLKYALGASKPGSEFVLHAIAIYTPTVGSPATVGQALTSSPFTSLATTHVDVEFYCAANGDYIDFRSSVSVHGAVGTITLSPDASMTNVEFRLVSHAGP